MRLETRCCIAGGGPAGVMLGYLLARAGIDVLALERWPDFFRDFRGDTIHPSTLEALHELGLLDSFLQLPHDETRQLTAHIGGEAITISDFTHLKVHCPFVAFIPQWDFLDFLTAEGKSQPAFRLRMETEAIDLIVERGQLPTRLTQRLQIVLQNHVIAPALRSRGHISAPWPARMFNWFPLLRRIPARLIGMGFRPEHVGEPIGHLAG